MFIGSIVESVEKLFVAWKRLLLGKYLQCFNTGRRLTNNKKKKQANCFAVCTCDVNL